MPVSRKIATVSLIAMLAFGTGGCAISANIKSGPAGYTTVQSQVQDSVQDEVRKVVIKAAKLNYDPEVGVLVKEVAFMNANPSVPEFKSLFEKHDVAMQKINTVIEHDDKAAEQYLNNMEKSGNDKGFAAELRKPENKDLMNSILSTTIISSLVFEHGDGDYTFNVVAGGFKTHSGGKVSVLDKSAYLEDKNGGIVDFLTFIAGDMVFSQDGKKISFDTLNRSEIPAEENELSSDITNLAASVESWLVDQKDDDIPLKAYEQELINKTEVSGNILLTITGTSMGYKIMGTSNETGQTLVYDSKNRNLQAVTESDGSKFPDYLLFVDYEKLLADTTKQSGSPKVTDFVDILNAGSDQKVFEAIVKDDKEYIKVTHPKSVLAKQGDLMYAFIPSEK